MGRLLRDGGTKPKIVRDIKGEEVEDMLRSCLKQNREAQRKLYEFFYGYAMSICMRYSKDAEAARDVLNDGFLKVFTKLELYDSKVPFKGWLRRIMINTALDNYRHELKHYYHIDIDMGQPIADTYDVLQQINYEYLISLIQKLTPGYRAVFNLHVIDGYTHEEIAETLGITVGTSKSNLAKARVNLRAALEKSRIDEQKQYV